MNRPKWWPVNPIEWYAIKGDPGRAPRLWDLGAQAMAKAMIERVEALSVPCHDPSGGTVIILDPVDWEALKAEVEQS